jgi:hypothetical protein
MVSRSEVAGWSKVPGLTGILPDARRAATAAASDGRRLMEKAFTTLGIPFSP